MQSSKPALTIVQDGLLGMYHMTKFNKKLSREDFQNIAVYLHKPPWCSEGCNLSTYINNRVYKIRRVLFTCNKPIRAYNGRGLISLFLPPSFNYYKRNDKDEQEPAVKIIKGVLVEGVFDKSIIGGSHGAIQHLLNKEYGPDIASYFMDSVQFLANRYLLKHGFTIGLGDCLIPKSSVYKGHTKEYDISLVIQKCYIEADGIQQTTYHPGIREMRVNASLNKAKDIGLRIAKESLHDNNNFLSTVYSGSKGDFFNIAQITGLLGQQNLEGKRVPLLLNNGTRSLPHYPFENVDSRMEYESRGFIDRGFLRGLTPRQFYFHAMSGREGICDTSLGTATSGYIQRRICKLTEDLKINYDGTVRDSTNKIYQFAYGEDNIDPSKTLKVNNQQQVCDVARIVNRLNAKYESNKLFTL